MSYREQIQDIHACHSKQKGFMDIYDTEEGQNFKIMNLRDDTLCITDNDPLDHSQKINNQDEYQKFTEIPKDYQNYAKKTLEIDTSKSILSSKSIINHHMVHKQQSILSAKPLEFMKLRSELDNDSTLIGKQKTKYSIKNMNFNNLRQQESIPRDFESDASQSQNNTGILNKNNKNPFDNIQVTMLMKIKKKMQYFYQNFTQSGRRSFLEWDSVHRTLNDKSDGYMENKLRNFIKQLLLQMSYSIKKYLLSSYLSQFPVMDQQSRLSLFFLIFFVLFNSFFFLLFSIILVFDNALTFTQYYLYKITLICWVVEILRKLNTSTHQESTVITERRKIFMVYLKNRAFQDLVPSLVLLTIIWNEQNEIEIQNTTKFFYYSIKIIGFIKLKNLMSDVEELQKSLCILMKRYYIMKLANLIIKLFLIGHVISCLWYLIAQIEVKFIGEEETWYNEGISSDLTWWKVYLLSMYWALTLMTTGSNIATTVLQTFFTSFIMLFTTIISGYMLNATGEILCEIGASEENKKNDLNIINDYMREKNISMSLQRRVNIYLEYYYEKNYQKSNEETKGVLSKISNELTNLMRKEYFLEILTKIDFLQKNFSIQTLENLATQCEEEAYFPNQVIFRENDFSDSALLMIIEGSVEIYSQNGQNGKDHKTICFLKKGQILGQINFFTGMARTASARSQGFTKIAKISNSSFLEVIKDHSKDFQTFYQMKDQILLYENYQSMNIKCTACGSFKHLQSSCSLVHFNKDFAKDVIKIKQGYRQERKNQQRNSRKKQNSLRIILKVFENGIRYLEKMIEHNEIEINDDDDDDDNEDSLSDESNEGQKSQDEETSINQIQERTLSFQAELKTINEIPEEDEKRQRKLSVLHEYPPNILNKQKNEGEDHQLQGLVPDSPTKDYHKNKINPIYNFLMVQSNNSKEYQMHQDSQKIDKKYKSQNSNTSQENQQNKLRSLPSNVSQLLKKDNTKYRGSLQKVQISPEFQYNEEQSLRQNQKSNASITQLEQKKKKKKSIPSSKLINKQLSLSIDEKTKIQHIIHSNNNNNYLSIDNVEISEYLKEKIMWDLDKLRDYEYYFNLGNSKIILNQFKNYQKKREIMYYNLKIQKVKKNNTKRGTVQMLSKIKNNASKNSPSHFQAQID